MAETDATPTSVTQPTTPPTGDPEHDAAHDMARRPLFTRIPPEAVLGVFLVILLVFFSVTSEFFFAVGNLRNILLAVSVLGILAAPQTMLLVSGNVDLSVASAAALAGMVVAQVSGGGEGSVVAGLLAGLAAGLLVGVINGGLVTAIRINSLITTLGGLAAYRGVAQLLSNGQTVRTSGYRPLGSGAILGIPVPVLLFAAVAIGFWMVMRFTVFGRNVYAIGANPQAARLAGIRTGRSLFVVFALSGLCAGLAGAVLVGQLSAASPVAAAGLELSVIAAVILGGASLTGGRGTIVGTVLGVLILGTLNNGLTIASVSSFWQEVARGLVLVVAVGFDQIRIRLGGAA